MMREEKDEYESWAHQEFGRADLGDLRRTRRLVAMAAAAARQPAGTVTAVFKGSAEREAAFRFLGNADVSAEAIAVSTHIATVERCRDFEYVFVALDPTSLTLTDRTQNKGFGRVGASNKLAQGLHVMNALAVAPDGAPLGLCEQLWWVRDKPPTVRPANRKGSYRGAFDEKETRYWIDALTQTQQLFAQHADGVRPWFQLDRGGDCWPVLALATQMNLLLTVRSVHNRRLKDGKTRAYLWQTVEAQPVLGRYSVEVPARPALAGQPARPARVAKMAVRACKVTIELRVGRKRRQNVTLYAVLARELSNAPERLEWKLLTTHPVDSFEQACTVIEGYSCRWRVEEFHRAWKSGVCNVEDSQLRAADHFIKWATMLATVAARAVRLSYLARSQPELPATDELTQDQIDAILLLKKRTPYRRGDVPTLGEAVRWIADIGGYTGKSSGGPPGAKVIARGLQRIDPVAEALKNIRELKM